MTREIEGDSKVYSGIPMGFWGHCKARKAKRLRVKCYDPFERSMPAFHSFALGSVQNELRYRESSVGSPTGPLVANTSADPGGASGLHARL